MRCLLLFCFAFCLPAAAEWHVSGYVGVAHTQASDLLVNQSALGTELRFRSVNYSGKSFQAPLYYGVRGGYFFSGHWGVEAEFTHLKVFAIVNQPVHVSGMLNGKAIDAVVPMDSLVQRFSISHGVNLLLVNIALREQLFRDSNHLGRILLNIRLGAGATIPHPESEILGHVDEHYQTGSPVTQASVGAEFRIFRKLYWTGDYKYTRTRQHVDVFSGEADSLLRSHHFVTGPVIHF
jgi:lipid A oxidase